jgi:hypothetical protein
VRQALRWTLVSPPGRAVGPSTESAQAARGGLNCVALMILKAAADFFAELDRPHKIS